VGVNLIYKENKSYFRNVILIEKRVLTWTFSVLGQGFKREIILL